MKDEIKEINITFPGQILDYVDTKEHLLELFNYITNLQEENERLKENAIHNDKVVDEAKWNEMLYKSRNEKAIEKIKKIQENAIKYGANHDAIICQDLLNILEGDDKE